MVNRFRSMYSLLERQIVYTQSSLKESMINSKLPPHLHSVKKFIFSSKVTLLGEEMFVQANIVNSVKDQLDTAENASLDRTDN